MDLSSLVFYLGTIPLLSLLFTTISLFAYHFNLISTTPLTPPTLPINTPTSPICPPSRPSTTTTLTSLLATLGLTAAWLIQSSFLTACELQPVLSGHQGHVPSICPQSHFHNTSNPNIPSMLSGAAIGKSILSWVMVVVSAAMSECARQGWNRARCAEMEDMRGGASRGYEEGWRDGGAGDLEVRGWKGRSVVVGINEVDQIHQQEERFELSSAPTFKSHQEMVREMGRARVRGYETRGTRDSEFVLGRGKYQQQDSGDGRGRVPTIKKKGEVVVGLDVGMGYESRI